MHRYLVRIVCLGLLSIHAIGVVAAQTSSQQAGENWTRAKARTGAAANTRVQAAIRPGIQLVAYEAGEALPAVDEQAPAPAPEQAPAPAPATPPIPSTPIVERFPGGAALLRIHFADNDLDPATAMAPNAFRIFQELTPSGAAISYLPVLFDGTPDVPPNGSVVELRFRNLNPGVYWIVFGPLEDKQGSAMPTPATSGSTFTPATETTGIKKSFIVPAGRELGEQVEYPRFLRPENQVSEFDPGDRVDTRVVQLYYFRDARLVAEYVNRNIQDLNQSGYDEAQRFAQQARVNAADKVDDRRFKETLAVEDAVKTRETEHQIEQAREELVKTNQLMQTITDRETQNDIALKKFGETKDSLSASIGNTLNDIDAKGKNLQLAEGEVAQIPFYKGQVDSLQSQVDEQQKLQTAVDAAQGDANVAAAKAAKRKFDEKHPSLVERLAEAKGKQTKAEEIDLDQLDTKLVGARNKAVALNALNSSIIRTASDRNLVAARQTELRASLSSLPTTLINQQTKEINSRNDVVKAEAFELRAAQEEFRREVAAGLADRNSYARGKKASIDPVAQVTISVVGTSRLQLRGPIKGVNKICRMVHQLDSPVGQVKLGIHTVQVNGEHGDRMDFVYERINQEIAHSRFLVSTSAQLMRRAVHEVAAEVALAADEGYLPDGCPPDLTTGVATLNGTVQTTSEQRDRRYLYAFFGSDFISELEEMDSELLNTENKMLSLHSMDTVSLAGALFVMAHADHPVRQRIVMRFQELLAGELPQRETEYVQALTHVTSHGKSLQNRFRKAIKIDNKNAAEIYFNAARTYHFPNTISYFNDQIAGQGTLNPVQYSTVKMAQALKAQLVAEMELNNHVLERSLLETKVGETAEDYARSLTVASALSKKADSQAEVASESVAIALFATAENGLAGLPQNERINLSSATEAINKLKTALRSPVAMSQIIQAAIVVSRKDDVSFIDQVWDATLTASGVDQDTSDVVFAVLAKSLIHAKTPGTDLSKAFRSFHDQIRVLIDARQDEADAKQLVAEKEEEVFSQRLLDQFIDEQEEKSVELMEALRSHSSNVDNYLKRLAIAVEDDVAAQFYEPAFQRIRRVSRTWDVTLGQIETTTVLTNNRTLAKVSPSATFEFDLPQRDILLTEALNGSKTLANEYGNLLKDGTFLAGTAMLSGQPPTGIVGGNAPIQGIPGMQQNQDFGSELQKLIPDPAIYKFETGTGFEIQPIIQPDGHSIVYGFDYMYSTNVREPVRADEKHLGRIKRHFVHTDVQTSSYELREISRYTVALKASRTDRGVPLFEDLPGVGAAFRPLPSEESSLQTNIILGSSTIYPTVFDLMGLRWSAYVDRLSSSGIATEKETQANRREELRTHLLDKTRDKVNKRVGLQLPHDPTTNHIAPGYLPYGQR